MLVCQSAQKIIFIIISFTFFFRMKMKMNFNLSFQSENQENELISNHYMILFNKKVNIIQSRFVFFYACTVSNIYLPLFIVTFAYDYSFDINYLLISVPPLEGAQSNFI